MTRWSDVAADLNLDVECGGATHTLRWSHGAVTMVDHPDEDAERALVGFGGEPPRCLELLDLWTDAITDGGFLEEWVDEEHLSRSYLMWLETALERMRMERFQEFLRSLPMARAQRMGEFVFAFPRPWIDRAGASVAERIVDGEGVVCDRAAELLDVAITNRVRKAFVAAVGGRELTMGAAALVRLVVLVTDDTAGVRGRIGTAGSGVELTVPRHWLHRVWAAGAATIDGSFTLDLTHAADGSTATSVTWTDGEPEVIERRLARGPASWGLG